MTIRVERKTTIRLPTAQVNLGELTQVLKEFPAAATIRFNYYRGDPKDPREYDTLSMEITLPPPSTIPMHMEHR